MQQLVGNPVDDDSDDKCDVHCRRRRLNIIGELDRCGGGGASECTAQKFAQKYAKQSMILHNIITSRHRNHHSNHHIRLLHVDDHRDKKSLLKIYNQSKCTNHYNQVNRRHHRIQPTLSSLILYISTISLVLVWALASASQQQTTDTNTVIHHSLNHNVDDPVDRSQYSSSDRESNYHNVPSGANQHPIQYRQSPHNGGPGGSGDRVPPLCNDCLAIPLIAIMGNGKQVNGFIIQSPNQQQQQNNHEANRQHINRQRSPALPMRHEPVYERPNAHTQALTIQHSAPKLEPKSDDKCPMKGPLTVCDQIDSYPAEEILHKLEVAKKRLGQTCFNIDSLFSDERDHSSEPFDEPQPINLHKNKQQQKPPPPPPRMTSSKSVHSTKAPHQTNSHHHHHHHHHHQNYQMRPDSRPFNHHHHARNGPTTNSTQRPRYSPDYVASGGDGEANSVSPDLLQPISGPALAGASNDGLSANVQRVRQDPRVGQHHHHQQQNHAISIRTIAGQDAADQRRENKQSKQQQQPMEEPTQLAARPESNPMNPNNGALDGNDNYGQTMSGHLDDSYPSEVGAPRNTGEGEESGQASRADDSEFLRIVEGRAVSLSEPSAKQAIRRKYQLIAANGHEGKDDAGAIVGRGGGDNSDNRHAVKRSQSFDYFDRPQVNLNPAELTSSASQVKPSWSSISYGPNGNRRSGADKQGKLVVVASRPSERNSSDVEGNDNDYQDKVVSRVEAPSDPISSKVASASSYSSTPVSSSEFTTNSSHYKGTSVAIVESTTGANLSVSDKRRRPRSSRLASDQPTQLQAPKSSAADIRTDPRRPLAITTTQDANNKRGHRPHRLATTTKPQNVTAKVVGQQRQRQLSRRQVANVRVDVTSGGGTPNGRPGENVDSDGGSSGETGDVSSASPASPTEPADGPIQPEPVCRARSIYISPKAALNDKKQWKYVVNARERDPRIRQIIRVDICENPFGPCSDQVSLPFGFISQCKQKYAKKKLLALDAQSGLLEVDTFFIPSCCVCQLIPDTRGPLSTSTLEGSEPSLPITTTVSSNEQPDTDTPTGASSVQDDPRPGTDPAGETAAGGGGDAPEGSQTSSA